MQAGETISCIARAYGVAPVAIAEANSVAGTYTISPGQVLQIPGVPWTDIPAGPVCAPQFQSPFPGAAAASATRSASPSPAGAPLRLSLNFNCVANCGAKAGQYVVRVQLVASGGLAPYGYIPAQTYDVPVPHCTTGQGTASVTDADGEMVQMGWTYHDVACS